jgi:curved DNA-binding protein CbpA
VQTGSSDLEALGIMIDEGENAHEILGLPRNASGAEVREAYIRLVKQYHPDMHPGDLAAERRFKRITRAYNELRSSYHFRGLQTYGAPVFWGSYRQALAIAVMFFVLTPLAVFLVMRSEDRSVPSLALEQAEGTAPVKETAIEPASGPLAPQERTAALKIDRLMRSSTMLQAPPIIHERSSDVSADGIPVASLSERMAQDARFPGSASPEAHPSEGSDGAHSSPEAAPPGQARFASFQAPSPHDEIAVAPADDMVQPGNQDDQKKVASVQPGMQDARNPPVELQALPHRSLAAVERTGEKSIVPSKTVNSAPISTTGQKQRLGPELSARPARAALLEHSLDRIVLTAAPGG